MRRRRLHTIAKPSRLALQADHPGGRDGPARWPSRTRSGKSATARPITSNATVTKVMAARRQGRSAIRCSGNTTVSNSRYAAYGRLSSRVSRPTLDGPGLARDAL